MYCLVSESFSLLQGPALDCPGAAAKISSGSVAWGVPFRPDNLSQSCPAETRCFGRSRDGKLWWKVEATASELIPGGNLEAHKGLDKIQ